MAKVLAFAACVLTACSSSPVAPAVQSWVPGLALSTSVTTRGFSDLRGLIHAHSPYSHDACDYNPRPDGGDIDRSCLADFRRGICQARHDYVFVTDHGESFNRTEFPEVLLYDASQHDTLELLDDGRPVGNHLSCPDGHSVFIMAGTESDMLPIGLTQHIATTKEARDAIYGQVTAQNISTLRDAGAVVIIQHTENWSADQLSTLPINGFEMYNLHNNALLNAGYFVDLLPKLDVHDFSGLPHPDLTFGLLRDIEQPKYLNTWATVLARGHHRVTTMGTDSHRNTFPQVLADGERVDSYRRMMMMFSNHVLVRGAVTRESVVEAVASGRLYGVFEVLGYAEGFDFRAQAQGATHELGSTVPVGAELIATMPAVKQLDPTVTPPLLKLRILKAQEGSWQEVAATTSSGELRFTTTVSGAYRAEVRMVPRHLTALFGDSSAAAAVQRPWVYSNAIYVE